MLTELEIKLLNKYEDRLRQSRSNYLRAITSIDLHKLNEIYEKITGNKYHLNSACSTCQLKFIQSLDKVYHKYLLEQKELEPITDNQIVNNNEDTITSTKNKKRRKL